MKTLMFLLAASAVTASAAQALEFNPVVCHYTYSTTNANGADVTTEKDFNIKAVGTMYNDTIPSNFPDTQYWILSMPPSGGMPQTIMLSVLHKKGLQNLTFTGTNPDFENQLYKDENGTDFPSDFEKIHCSIQK